MLANVNKPSDANVCHANDSYKVKSMRKKRSARSQKPCNNETQFPTVRGVLGLYKFRPKLVDNAKKLAKNGVTSDCLQIWLTGS